MDNYYIYMLTNYRNTILYVGVTNNLIRRISEHKNKSLPGFTQKYNLNKLVYYEQTASIETALQREKQLKKWKRAFKEELIEKMNSSWKGLSDTF